MSSSAADPHRLVEFLRAQRPGARVWVRGMGRSMYPMLRSGDAVLVERCGEDAVRPGDWALVASSSGGLVAHVVASVDPLRTESFLGAADAPGAELMGRIVRVRVRGVSLPIAGVLRGPLQVLRDGLVSARRSSAGGRALRRLREAAYSPATRLVRLPWVGRVHARLLTPDDEEQVLLFFGDHLSHAPAFVRERLRGRWQTHGLAVGAFSRTGAMVGFVWVDSYESEGLPLPGNWIRTLYVAPIARGMGVAQEVLRTAVDAWHRRGGGELFADVRAENVASVHLFEAFGFENASPELVARVNEVWRTRFPQATYRVFRLTPT